MQPDSLKDQVVCGTSCLWGHALKRSPGINHNSRVWYPGHRFLSSDTWPSMPKKHYNGFIIIYIFFVFLQMKEL